jgi:hypothetical protein
MAKTHLAFNLTKEEIDAIFAAVDDKKRKKQIELLATYQYLQKHLDHVKEPDYQKKFNYFYQVRRNAEWRAKFYNLFSNYAHNRIANFEQILYELSDATDRIEMSFASKLAATIDPDLPVIDRHVLSYLGWKSTLPREDKEGRIAEIIDLHVTMKEVFNEFLKNANGQYLINTFATVYPEQEIGNMKILDFALWQSGGKKEKMR